jgi:hypothetical protein
MSFLRTSNTTPRNQTEATKLPIDWPNGISSALVRLTVMIE